MSDKTAPAAPSVSRLRVTILVCILIAIVAAVAWNTRMFFRLNHIDFLLNQREFDRGLTLLQKLDSGNGTSARAGMLQTKALTLIGNYDEAIAAADRAGNSGENPAPALFYWKTLAQFQAGQTTASQASATQFLATGEQLPNGTEAIVQALAGKAVLAEIPAPDALPFRMMLPVEQATYLALVAMEQANLGHFDLAARVYERAFLLGNRNAASLQNAALVSALTGDVHSARMYLDFAGPGSMEKLRAELERRFGQAGQAKLTLHEDLAPGRRRVDVARALAWAATQADHQTSHTADQDDPFSRLLKNYATDPVIRLSQADYLAANSKTSAALAIYSELQLSDPTLATQLRIASLTSSSQTIELPDAVQTFLKNLNPVAVLRLQSEQTSLNTRSPSAAHITARHPANISFNLESRGSYIISIIARATNRQGKWPLLYAKAGDETIGLCYVSGEKWEIYSVKAALEPGRQQLEFTFSKGDELQENQTVSPGKVACAMVIISGSGAPE